MLDSNPMVEEMSPGGPPRDFPRTTWGMVVRVRDPRNPECRAGMEQLCQRYWDPICQYARAAWARSDEDARDLTQDFFVWLLEGEVLARYAPELGSFRNFLKGLLRNFGRNAAQAARRLKRGGGRPVLSLQDESVPEPAIAAAEEAFDRAWVEAVTGRAIAKVRAKLEAGPRAVQWKAFEAYDLAAPDAKPTYGAVAAALGIKESDVRNHLFSVREKVRAEIRAELCDTVSSNRDLEDEWRRVVGS